MSESLKFFKYLLFAAIIAVLDQVTKQIALDRLSDLPPVDVLPILQWALVFNRGAAFGFLQDAGGGQHIFLFGVAAIVCLVIVVGLWRTPHGNLLFVWGMILILGGGVGNVVDRIRYRFVIDFINMHYHDWYFPAFNIADMSITFGAICLIVDVFINQR